ncbi:MAG TPA: FAD-dependent oxidoreductase [Polyangiaceae bacterium]|nr:FAD-dependent oxidoreductase [Polyangiaceae bacterium]
MERAFDVVVVGGGLAGLAAAAYLGRAGLRPIVIEKARELGGRGRTTVQAGFSLNLGAHALYRKGPAWGVLEELGVAVRGGVPKASGALALAEGRAHALPGGLVSLLTTGLLPLAGKLELSRLLATLPGLDAAALAGVPTAAWVDGALKTPAARAFVRAFVRVSTYAADLERLSAGAAVAQLQHAIKHNVLYLDGGWQTLVDGLRDRAAEAGAVIAPGGGAARLEARGPGEVRVRLHDGRAISARAAVLAVGPQAAAALAPALPALAAFAGRARPVKIAALDLGLSKLPRPRVAFGLGTTRPTYVSVHSAVARLAPEGAAAVHAMLYEPSGDARADERELEGALDLVQPGWREHVAYRRFLPAMVAANDLVEASRGGYAGRPGVAVPGATGVFVAGDWVGPTGMLLDASLASARRAASECAALLAREARPATANARAPEPALA